MLVKGFKALHCMPPWFLAGSSRQLARLNNMPVKGSSLEWTVGTVVGRRTEYFRMDKSISPLKVKPTRGTDRP